MQIKISDIINIPDLEGILILNNDYYSNNIVDRLEVVDDLNMTPSMCSLCIINYDLISESDDEITSFIKRCNGKLVSGVILSQPMLNKIKASKTMGKNLFLSNVPLMAVPEEITFFKVVNSIQSFMIEYYKTKFDTVIDINNHFSYISLKTPDIKLMIEYFKSIIGNPIMIYDEFFNIIVSTDEYIKKYERVPGTEEKNFLKNLYYYRQRILLPDAENNKQVYDRILFPITFEKRDKAFLAVFEINDKLRDIDYTILEICATSALIEMKRLMALKKIEEKYLNDFLYDLIYRTDNKSDDIKRRAEIFNIHESSDYCCIIFDVHFNENYKQKNNTQDELKDIILNSITSFLSKSNVQSLASRFGRSMLILHKTDSNSIESYNKVKEMCISLKKYLTSRHDFITVHVGIGSIIDNLRSVSRSYQEAISSLSFGRTVYDETFDFVVSYNDSSLLKIFSKVKDNKMLNEIIPESLKTLKKYDIDSNSDLVKTLSTYLDCNYNAKKASEKMFIHYKTMLYRLDKITKEFDIDISSSNSRIQIELALQIINIMEAHEHSDISM